MLKRIVNYNKEDWKHISFLLKNSVIQFYKGNFNDSIDALYWIKIHLTYDSTKVK